MVSTGAKAEVFRPPPVSLARMAFSAAFLTSSYTVAMSTFA